MTIISEWTSGTRTIEGASGSVTYTEQESFPQNQMRMVRTGAGTYFTVFPLGGVLNEIAVRGYYKTPEAWPSSSASLVTIGRLSQPGPRFTIAGTGAPGQIRLIAVGGAQAAVSSTNAISLDTMYRFELQCRNGGAQARLALFPLASDLAIWDSGWTSGNFGTDHDSVFAGAWPNAAPALVDTYANFLITDDASDLLGRDPLDQPSMPSMQSFQFWDGTVLKNATPAGIWNGTELIPLVAGGSTETGPSILAEMDFEAFSEGNQITDISPWRTVTTGAATMTATTEAAMAGAMGCRVVTNTGTSRLIYDKPDDGDTLVMASKIKVRNDPSGNVLVMRSSDSTGAYLGDWRIHPNRTVSIRTGTTAAGSSPQVLEIDKEYWVQWKVSGEGHSLRIYDGENLYISLSADAGVPTYNELTLGSHTNSGCTFDIDNVVIASDYLTP